MVEHNGECKPFDFCSSLYTTTTTTTTTTTPKCPENQYWGNALCGGVLSHYYCCETPNNVDYFDYLELPQKVCTEDPPLCGYFPPACTCSPGKIQNQKLRQIMRHKMSLIYFRIPKGMVEHNGQCKPFDFCSSLYNPAVSAMPGPANEPTTAPSVVFVG